MSQNLEKKIVHQLYPFWRRNHQIHFPQIPNKFYSSLKQFLEKENFLENLEESKFTPRDILYIFLSTISKDIPNDILSQIDEVYKEESKSLQRVNIKKLTNKKIVVWKGDITTLEIDGIVNAANSYLLGCFLPFHKCIDNVIHDKAGPRLRQECRSWNVSFEEPGKARISKGYHLPSKYVLHTVGPIYDERIDQSTILKDCYVSCLDVGKQNGLKSLAFCCISTVVFGYPNKEAAELACEAVNDWMRKNPNVYDQIVFNVFKEEDYELYKVIAPKYFQEKELEIL